MLAKTKMFFLCEGGIGKSVPQDHHLSSLGRPPDDKWSSLEQILLSHLHTRDGFLYNLMLYHSDVRLCSKTMSYRMLVKSAEQKK